MKRRKKNVCKRKIFESVRRIEYTGYHVGEGEYDARKYAAKIHFRGESIDCELRRYTNGALSIIGARNENMSAEEMQYQDELLCDFVEKIEDSLPSGVKGIYFVYNI